MDVKPDFNYNKGVPDVKRQGDVKGQMVTIMEQILRFKERVSKYIDDNYVDFMPNNSTIYILEEGKMLEKEAYDLLNSLQCTSPQFDSELLSTIRKFEKIVWDLDVTNRVLSADELFQMLEETSSNEHMIALDLLKKMINLLHSSANNNVQKMLLSSPCYDTVKVKYHLHFHAVKSNLREKFQQLVQFSEKQLPSAACATIQVSKDVNQLQDTVLALFQVSFTGWTNINTIYGFTSIRLNTM